MHIMSFSVHCFVFLFLPYFPHFKFVITFILCNQVTQEEWMEIQILIFLAIVHTQWLKPKPHGFHAFYKTVWKYWVYVSSKNNINGSLQVLSNMKDLRKTKKTKESEQEAFHKVYENYGTI